MKPFLCFLGLHEWELCEGRWYVIGWKRAYRCKRCGIIAWRIEK